MKKSFYKVLPVLFGLLVFFGCKQDVALDEEHDPDATPPVSVDTGTDTTSKTGTEASTAEETTEVSNPSFRGPRATNLDLIFDNQTLGTTTITIKRSEWNALCDNYRYFYKNENCVKAESYKYEKNGQSWNLTNVGFRLRGNTSRYCPQGIDNGNEQGQMNNDWNSAYYQYANQPNNDYRQTHFKVDFEEFCADGEEQKMADCLKGMALKRMDGSCTREIFCYDLFRKNGIWTAPRASHTRVIINIIEDETDNSTTKVDYGVYEMFEEVNKQSLKARDTDENGYLNAWKNSKGYLWKCSNDLTNPSSAMGVEDIRIIFAGESEPGMKTNGREDSKRIGYVWDRYSLDLKTNKSEFSSAASEFSTFMTELNSLSDTDTNAIKAFYEKWFDVDFFIKSYAINVICGMDDDYWGNSNNYYLYFGDDKHGNRKVYFIPFDYDNTLGASIKEGGFMHNPLKWGRGANRPLLDKLLSVPAYRDKYKSYLLELTSNTYWSYDTASALFSKWRTMVSPYLNTPDLNFTGLGTNSTSYGTWQPGGFSLIDKGNNIYDATRESFSNWISGKALDAYQIDTDTTQGFKIKIVNIPANAASREIYIDNKHVASIERDWGKPSTISDYIKDDTWQYPYTVDGKTYEVKVKYINTDYGTIAQTETFTVTANGGLGELSVNSGINYSVNNNKLVFSPAPVMKISNSTLPENTGYYSLETSKVNEGGDWIENKVIGSSCSDVDLNKYFPRDKGISTSTIFKFKLYYEIPNSRGDKYRFVILDMNDTQNAGLRLTSDFPTLLSVDSSATDVGLNIKILASEIPSAAYSRDVLIDGRLAIRMERNYSNPNTPNEHIMDSTFNYPYVQPGKTYKVRVKYFNESWSTVLDTGEIEFTPDSGAGELQLINKDSISYRIENNKLIITRPQFINTRPNAKLKLDLTRTRDNQWLCGPEANYSDISGNTIEVDLSSIISKTVYASDSLHFKFFVIDFYGNDTNKDSKGYEYYYEILSENDTKNKGLHLTSDLIKE